MKKNIIITSLEQLKTGMKVSFKDNVLSDYHDAIVTGVEYKQKCRMIDGKPVRALSLDAVYLESNKGETIIKESNFKNFSILAKIK